MCMGEGREGCAGAGRRPARMPVTTPMHMHTSSSNWTANEREAFSMGGRPPPPLSAHVTTSVFGLGDAPPRSALSEMTPPRPPRPRQHRQHDLPASIAASGSVPGVVYPRPGT